MEIANQNIDIEVVETGSETAQYFWHEATGPDAGAHVTEVPQEEWSDAGDPNYHSGGNVLVQSTAVSVRDGMKDLAVMSKDGFDAKTYDAQDNEVVIAHLGYGPGTDSGGGTSDAPYYTLGERLSGSGVGNYSHAEGKDTAASGFASHAEGRETRSAGLETHAEGRETIAFGLGSHSEGGLSKATGNFSHAEGYDTNASGNYSHAEGRETTASGSYSHAGGLSTIAKRKSQTAVGEYNIQDTTGLNENTRGEYALIIGNGTADNARSNALTVDWNGNTDIPSGSQYKVNNKTATFDALTVTTESFSYPAISNGSASGARTATFSNPGYYPLGVIGLRTGTSAAVPTRFNLSSRSSGSATFSYVLRAVGAVSAGSGDVDILWVKE